MAHGRVGRHSISLLCDAEILCGCLREGRAGVFSWFLMTGCIMGSGEGEPAQVLTGSNPSL